MYKDIINIHQNSIIQQIVKNIVYYNLEGGWRINKTHRHYPEFKKAISVTEGGFPFFSFRHSNKVKS